MGETPTCPSGDSCRVRTTRPRAMGVVPKDGEIRSDSIPPIARSPAYPQNLCESFSPNCPKNRTVGTYVQSGQSCEASPAEAV